MPKTHFEKQPGIGTDILFYHFTSHNKILFHRHDRLEIICLRRGHILFSVGSKEIMLNAGDIAVVNPCERHGSSRLSADNDYFVFLVPRSVFASCTREYRFAETVKKDSACFECAETAASLFENASAENAFLRRAEIYRLLHLLSAHASGFSPAVAGSTDDSEITAGIKTLIRTRYAEPFSLDDLAQSFCVSVSNLQHTFKHDTGMSILNYLKLTRVENAKNLLTHTEYTVSEIARSTGFTDHNYFTRVFSSVAGMPPRKYRATQREKK